MVLRRPRVPNVPRDTRERRELGCCDRNSPQQPTPATSSPCNILEPDFKVAKQGT